MKHLLFVLFVIVNRVYGDTHAFDDHEINLEESIAEHTHPYGNHHHCHDKRWFFD